ncbi:MAG: AbrB family transcriptional regulator [Thalassobaculaceae bacterium]|nr:AbrB family transcriptional regulator [Thalassobaculaceae bacterium]
MTQLPLKQIGLWLLTLVLGGIGGYGFSHLGVPLAWLLGSLAVVAAVGLCGGRLAMPPGARQTGQVLLGSAIGLTFTPQVAAFVAGFLPIMIGAALLSIGYGVLAGLALKRTAGTDPATAFFSSVPGGVVEMSVQAERYNGDISSVSLAQSLRILLVVTTIPPIVTLLGLTGSDPFELIVLPFDPLGFIVLVAACSVLGWLGARRKIANAWFLGPMIVAVAVSVSGNVLSGVPTELINFAQVVMGATLGLRYQRDRVLALRRFLPPAFLSTVILVGLNVLTGAAIGLIFGLPVATMALAISPGGMAEMSITAKVLHLGVPIVVAFHVVRIFLVIGFTGMVFKRVFLRETKTRDSGAF